VFEGEGRHFEESMATHEDRWVWPARREAEDLPEEEASKKSSAQLKEVISRRDTPEGRGKHDPEVLSQEKRKDDEKHVSTPEGREPCREDRHSKGEKETPAEGKPPPVEEPNGPPE
jgi:hypothetical protein